MAQKIHLDIETYSSVDLKTSGVYKYVESVDFEILLLAYAFDGGTVHIVDLANGESIPDELIKALKDPTTQKHAHNATFERVSLRQIGIDIPPEEWRCSMIKSAYCGLPLSLEAVSEALNLSDKGKSHTGRALINYFCNPVKPTKVNGGRTRNFPEHDAEKWEAFKEYCKQDVVAERSIDSSLRDYKLPETELRHYQLDQTISDRGIKIDVDMALSAISIDTEHSGNLIRRMKEITGLDNPNSLAQLTKWVSKAMRKDIKSLAKGKIQALIDETDDEAVIEVLKLRRRTSKTSIKKYEAMISCALSDHRAHGLLQFYGAMRTGRWAGRLIQLQNLPRNYIDELAYARSVFASGDYELATLMYDDISGTLSQLIRTAFIPKTGHLFAVADFSAIEARVIAWLANEEWRMDIFRSHGKIYEASASKMFKVPIEEVTKGSEYRAKGKIAELALGYQGAVGALKQMGAGDKGMSETEMRTLVKKWRSENKNIVKFWAGAEKAAKKALASKTRVETPYKGVAFSYDGRILKVHLPSGRHLSYYEPKFGVNKWGDRNIKYKGVQQNTRKWGYIDTYGGKIVENIVQAVARDLLAEALLRLDAHSFEIVMHVHDEVISEVPEEQAEIKLQEMQNIMSETPEWAAGLPLPADGYITPFYKKD